MSDAPASRGDDQAFALIRPLERTLGAALVVLVFAMMVVTFVDVTGRYLFNAPLPGGVEVTEIMMGIIVFAGLPLVSARNDHVTIDLMDVVIRGMAKKVQLVCAQIVSAAVIAFLAWRLYEKSREIASYGDVTTYLALPMAPLGYFMSAMAVLAAVVTAVLAVFYLRRPAPRMEP